MVVLLTISAADTAAKYDFLTNATANGGKVDGTAKPATVQSGTTVNYAAGKNLTVKQDIKQSIGEQTYTYSLNNVLWYYFHYQQWWSHNAL